MTPTASIPTPAVCRNSPHAPDTDPSALAAPNTNIRHLFCFHARNPNKSSHLQPHVFGAHFSNMRHSPPSPPSPRPFRAGYPDIQIGIPVTPALQKTPNSFVPHMAPAVPYPLPKEIAL